MLIHYRGHEPSIEVESEPMNPHVEYERSMMRNLHEMLIVFERVRVTPVESRDKNGKV